MPTEPSPDRTLSIMVVDDHPAIRDAVAYAVRGREGMTVVGTVGSASEAFELARRTVPDVAVIDVSLGDAHGLDVVQTLLVEHPALAVVVFSMYDEAVYAERALRAGARAYVRKTEPTSTVIDAIRSAAAGDVYLAQHAASRLLARMATGNAMATGGDGAASSVGLDALTDREMAVFQLLGQGRAPDDIADHLNLSRKTVETYRRRAKEKLGLGSVTELLQFSIRWTFAQEAGV